MKKKQPTFANNFFKKRKYHLGDDNIKDNMHIHVYAQSYTRIILSYRKHKMFSWTTYVTFKLRDCCFIILEKKEGQGKEGKK